MRHKRRLGARRVSLKLQRVVTVPLRFAVSLGASLWQGITVKIVPYSGHRVFNFRINVLTVIFIGLLVSLLGSSLFYLSASTAGATATLERRSSELEEAKASLEAILTEITELAQRSTTLQNAMTGTLEAFVGLGQAGGMQSRVESGAIELIGAETNVRSGELPEIEELRRLSTVLRGSVEPLKRIDAVLSSHNEVLSDIPNKWPVAGGRGRVTQEFGPHLHPFTGQWYLHRGIDIADTPGIPILASAGGRVTRAAYDQYNHGWHLVVEHKYGFKTVYSHLRRNLVSEGDIVKQGDQIGTLGSSGLSTGPHLHFEVHLGENVIDPAPFLKISNEFQRRAGRGRIAR